MANFSLSHIGEFGLIDQIKKIVPLSPRVVCGIGDDAAVLKSSRDENLLLTTDMLVEGRHFFRDVKAQALGHKALACSLSDIAAMGGEPWAAVVSLGLPATINTRFVKDLYQGMAALARKFSVAIVGGDTVAHDKIVVNVALLGRVKKKHFCRRSGARVGDMIFVSGKMGGSLPSGRHLRFVPRLKEAQYLVKNFLPTAMMDISDGLSQDLGHILKASQVGAVLYEELIPRSKGADLHHALGDGEDFELLFTLPPEAASRLLRQSGPFKFSCIGAVVAAKEGFLLLDARGRFRPCPQYGFKHF